MQERERSPADINGAVTSPQVPPYLQASQRSAGDNTAYVCVAGGGGDGGGGVISVTAAAFVSAAPRLWQDPAEPEVPGAGGVGPLQLQLPAQTLSKLLRR